MIKKFLLFLISIIIIVSSFLMPNVLLGIEDISREKEIFIRTKKESKIDVQAEKIYLVRFIHNIYDFKNVEVYYDGKTITKTSPLTERGDNVASEELKNEISKLVTTEIIKEINFDEIVDFYETLNIFFSEYTVITSDLITKNEGLGVGREEKTGKIINIEFPKSILRNDVSTKKQLENYAKYLDLDIIDDWKYENKILKSEKAQLSIVLEEKSDVCMLTIAPSEIYEEYKENHRNIVVEKKN